MISKKNQESLIKGKATKESFPSYLGQKSTKDFEERKISPPEKKFLLDPRTIQSDQKIPKLKLLQTSTNGSERPASEHDSGLNDDDCSFDSEANCHSDLRHFPAKNKGINPPKLMFDEGRNQFVAAQQVSFNSIDDEESGSWSSNEDFPNDRMENICSITSKDFIGSTKTVPNS